VDSAGRAHILHSWHLRRSRRTTLLRCLGRRPLPFAGIVSLHVSGRWSLAPDGRDRYQLAHFWDAGLWLTLRFHMPEDGVAGIRGRRDISLWKFCLPEADWRMLRIQVARQAAMPGRALNKESA